jgi:hypothetical protein
MSAMELTQQIMSKTRAGASLWTSLRWLSDILYCLCWIIALPVELVCNRRIGRRYFSTLPVIISVTIMTLFLTLGYASRLMLSSQLAELNQPRPMPRFGAPQAATSPTVDPAVIQQVMKDLSRELPLSGSPWVLWGALGLLGVAFFSHRLMNWWRFRTTEQVHSRACGMPHWVWWVWEVAHRNKRCNPSSPVGDALTPDQLKSAVAGGGLGDKLVELIDVASASLRRLWRSFGSDPTPSGPLAWACSTVIHPLLLGVGAIILTTIDPIYGAYGVLAAIAIFIKARIQKALVVEAIYDIFDARLEQVFMRGLERPEEMATAKRAGMVVPTLAEVLPSNMGRMPAGSAMTPELQALLNALRGDAETGPDQPKPPQPSQPAEPAGSGPVPRGQPPVV